MPTRALPFGLLLLLLSLCHAPLVGADTPGLTALSLKAVEADAAGGPLFRAIGSAECGIDFVQPIDLKHPLQYLYVGGFASPGVAIGDVNGDGVQDLFFSGGPVANRLYIQVVGNDGSATLRFRDSTTQANVAGADTWSAGASMVDIDNDGDLDIYVCSYDAPNQLYINETVSPDKIRFVESAKAFGLDMIDACLVSAFCDYDLDGDLDVLISGYQYTDPAGRPKRPPVKLVNGQYHVDAEYRKYYGVVKGEDGRPTFRNIGRQDYLLRSNVSTAGSEPIRFENVTRSAGIGGVGVGNSVVWWDFNEDGLPDIYVGNDFKVADQLFQNNGDGTFTDVIQRTMSHTTWFSMGSEVGDVNNDGRIDLFVSDMAGTTHYRSKVTMGAMGQNKLFMETSEPRQLMRNALFINNAARRMIDSAYFSGLANSDWTWAVKLADFDCDGWLDVYITNGAARMFNHSDMGVPESEKAGRTQWDLWKNTPPRKEENMAFRNLGGLQFEDSSERWGLGKSSMSYAAAYGDLDGDGDLDLVVAHLDEPITVYENRLAADQRRVRIRLDGTQSNRNGIGAVVRIETDNGQQVRQVTPMMGFMSCNEPLVHFGVGESETLNRLTVEWPSGVQQEFSDVATNRILMITEPARAQPVARAKRRNSPRMFVPSRTFTALKHVEQDYDDYERQPLLPYRHSQLGPGLAIGDIDGDGDNDFYMSRAKGSRRAVYHNQGNGRLGVKTVAPFQADIDREDLGSLFFDADGDGDQDLYVVSGSVECEPNDATLEDRLYLNDGQGVFRRADAESLPGQRSSGSVVCAADFDRDGDLDLFVGGRVIPGAYPESPQSVLLRNDGAARFSDATSDAAKTLDRIGLVTSAIWSDADGDGWIDLWVTVEWGPVRFFHNESAGSDRQLVDRTKEVGLANRLGWWNGIAARDLDNDGDIDYVVTNFGLNTTYHASDEKPELLFYGDFEGTGKRNLVEAKYEAEKCFPRRGLSCSSHAMPSVRKKLQTYHDFGLATLQDIYEPKSLDQSLRLVANTLESGVLLNLSQDGLPRFEFQPLPTLAQLSPAFGVVVGDFDADGWADCFVAQNLYAPQIETGRMDSGLSCVLRGSGQGTDKAFRWNEVWPDDSGIAIPHDAKAASLVDFNEDGWQDLLVTVNDGVLMAYESVPSPTNRTFRVRLAGPNGNPTGVGARVTVAFEDGSQQTAEVIAGGGYLSQSAPELSFGVGRTGGPKSVRVVWPSGNRQPQITEVERTQTIATIRVPETR